MADWGLFAIIVLSTLGSFALGRLSALMDARPVVSVSEAALTAPSRQMAMGGLIVASRAGSVYYYPWCAGAGKIAPASQRWFLSEKEALAAGYRPAKACDGLEGK